MRAHASWGATLTSTSTSAPAPRAWMTQSSRRALPTSGRSAATIHSIASSGCSAAAVASCAWSDRLRGLPDLRDVHCGTVDVNLVVDSGYPAERDVVVFAFLVPRQLEFVAF